jgi:hypothetical protein
LYVSEAFTFCDIEVFRFAAYDGFAPIISNHHMEDSVSVVT